jgi:TolA-binding protein
MLASTLLLAALTLTQDVPPAAPPAIEPVGAEPVAATPEPAPADSSTAATAIAAGLKAYKHRQFAQAETQFQKAVDADPNSAAAAYYLGYTVYKRVEKRPFHPDKARAARLFSQAFTLDPSFRPDWGRGR